MWDVVCLVLALLGVVLVLQLRAALGFVFPLYQVRVLPPGTTAPPDLQDLYAQADAELKALGYEGPAWFWRDATPQAGNPEHLAAAYRHPQQGAVFWLLPPTYVHAANRLSTHVISRLVDGRLAISQAYDSYFATTAIGKVLVQTVTPDSHAALAEQHRLWLATLGAAVAPDSAAPATLLDTAAPWMNRQRSLLLARGDLWRDAAGVVRPRLGLALRLLRAYWRQPKLPKDSTPVPAGRLLHFALFAERVAARRLPARLQWAFFAFSALAFALLGAWVWDWRSTLLLLLVIAIHEGGHYLAMRVFGYRNVHMMALPLLGGVTMGEEVKPSAAHRAWTSLMGPLPGIVIGWALLASVWAGWPWNAEQAPAVVNAALMFLALNYLNLLPVPPLDGARIVQAVFRPGWAWVQAAFMVLACGAGIVAAVAIGLPLLGVLAALQLLAVPGLLKQGRLLNAARAQGIPPVQVPHAQRLRHVFGLLEQLAGPARQAAQRVKQARALLQGADRTPLGWAHGALLVGLLAALLSVPAAVAVLYYQNIRMPALDAQQAGVPYEQRLAVQQARWRAEWREAAVPQLLGKFNQAGWAQRLLMPQAQAWPAAAPEAAITAAAQRLATPLPEDLRQLYQQHNGFPPLRIVPVAQLARASAWPASQGRLEAFDDGYDLRGPPGEAAAESTLHLDPQDLQHCVVLASFPRPPEADGTPVVLPGLWWCPADKATPERWRERWISAADRRIYPSLKSLLLNTAAKRQAARTIPY